MIKTVYLFLSPYFADWEYSLAPSIISDLNNDMPKKRSFKISTFALSKEAVTSCSGINVLPDCEIKDVDPDNAAMIILPGSHFYEQNEAKELAVLVKQCIDIGIPVAAICGGTLFLAKHGFLNSVSHTSCGPQWLIKNAPEYRGGSYYVHAPSVTDGNIITANPSGFIEFARDIIKKLDVLEQELLDIWFNTMKTGYFNVDLFESQTEEKPDDAKTDDTI